MDSCLTLGNELSEERNAVQARDFIGKGCRGRGKEGEGNGENCSARWLTVSGFMVIGLVSGLSLDSHSELGSFLEAHASLSRDGFQRGGYWEGARTSGRQTPISFLPLQNPGWWELVSSLFLTRTSCCKMTPASVFSSLLPDKGEWLVGHLTVSFGSLE